MVKNKKETTNVIKKKVVAPVITKEKEEVKKVPVVTVKETKELKDTINIKLIANHLSYRKWDDYSLTKDKLRLIPRKKYKIIR